MDMSSRLFSTVFPLSDQLLRIKFSIAWRKLLGWKLQKDTKGKLFTTQNECKYFHFTYKASLRQNGLVDRKRHQS